MSNAPSTLPATQPSFSPSVLEVAPTLQARVWASPRVQPMRRRPTAVPALPLATVPAKRVPETAAGAALDEQTLLDALRRGEDAAFEQVVLAYTPRLFAVARRLLRSEADAQDALQQAFLLAFRALPRFEGQCRLSTWLHRIVTNTALMMLRSAGRRREDFADDIHEDLLEQQPRGITTPWPVSVEEEMASRETREQVRAAINTLPDRYRTVLILRDVEGLSTEEAAVRLSLTPNATKVRLHRARQALMRVLQPVFGSERTRAAARRACA